MSDGKQKLFALLFFDSSDVYASEYVSEEAKPEMMLIFPVFHPVERLATFRLPEKNFKKKQFNFSKIVFYGRFLDKFVINIMLFKQNKFIFLNII